MQTKLEDNIQNTSMEAYYSILGELGDRQQQVLDIIKKYPNISNHEISNILDIPINSVTPRVKELRDLGLVVFCDIKLDRTTNRNVMTWKVK